MTMFALAAALTVLASAFAQEAPYRVIDGEIVYAGQTMSTVSDGSFQGEASASVPAAFLFDGGNVKWDQTYGGK